MTHEFTALQEKKKQLEDIRNFYKPIDKEELLEHQAAYQSIKKQKARLIQERREQDKREQKEHFQKLHHKPTLKVTGDEKLRGM